MLYGQYEKDGLTYSGKIEACGGGMGGSAISTLNFNVEDAALCGSESDTTGNYYNLPTQTANRPGNFKKVYFVCCVDVCVTIGGRWKRG